MAVLCYWSTRVEGKSCFTLVLVCWRQKKKKNTQSYRIWRYREYYILNIYVLSENVLKQDMMMTIQSFHWTNNLFFVIFASLQSWGNCVSFIVLFPLQYSCFSNLHFWCCLLLHANGYVQFSKYIKYFYNKNIYYSNWFL